MATANTARLRSFFNAVVLGDKPLGSQTRLFIDSVCAHQDPPACISSIIGSKKGLSSLQDAIRSDFSVPFLNGPATSLLRYLQAPALKTIGGGQFLIKVITVIVDPPIFWNQFVKSFRARELQDNSQVCFAWLLLQLILLPQEEAAPYRAIAEDKFTSSLLLNIADPEGKNLGQTIQRIVTTSAAVAQPSSGFSPGGRHDNDFVDFRDISILPTAEEIRFTGQPFLRPSSALDDPDTWDIRVALYLDNLFRLLREDMLYEMREELQVTLGLKKGLKNRAAIVKGLTLIGAQCGDGKRGKLGMMFQCQADLPQLKGQKGAAKRKQYLSENAQGKKILKHQSLACLLVDGEVLAFPTIIRDEELLAKELPIIVLQFDGQKSIQRTLLKLKSAEKTELIQINTAIFSYEPVLSAIQNIKDLPLSFELVFWQEGATLPMAEQDTEMFSLIQRIRRSPGQDLSHHLGSSTRIILDKAQEASLLSGLTQKVSLIQGPPGNIHDAKQIERILNCSFFEGTGKSFIGAILAKLFHDHSEQTILLVCYTNHGV